MSATAQASQTKNCITLKGSAQIITEYLKYGINSILFQRGIYPPETFENTQQYGLTILMTKDPKINEFLETVLAQTQEWMANNSIDKVSMVITNVYTREVLECWDFKIQPERLDNDDDAIDADDKDLVSTTKDMKRIQSEIRDVMRQISATVSYLPLLDCICTFDVLINTLMSTEIPKSWNETKPVFIANAQAVQLRSFSTGLHNVKTFVNYKTE